MTYIYWIYGLIAGVIGNFLAITCMMIAMNYQFTSGKKVAFSLGFGNSIVQILWSTIATFFMFPIKGFPPAVDKIFTALGIGIILYIAFKIFTFKIPEKIPNKKIAPKQYLKAFGIGFLLSFFAPQRILFYIGLFAAFRVHYSKIHHVIKNNIPLIVGVWIGSIIFWLFFILFMGHLKKKISYKKMKAIQKIGGFILIVIAIYSAASLMK